jgi:hypothetical protein
MEFGMWQAIEKLQDDAPEIPHIQYFKETQ